MKTHPHLGLGTAAIGRPQYINIRQETSGNLSLSAFRRQGLALLQTAYKLGIRYFDTAPGYGMAEALLMDWVQETGVNDIEIASKWGYTYTANFDPNASVHEVKEHSIEKLNEQWKVSQALLPQLKYYQIHSATFSTQVLTNEKVLDRLYDLKEAFGLKMGLSTTGSDQVEVLKQAIEVARNGRQLFDLFQVTYNVFDQSLREIANTMDVKWVVKEAMANGRVFPNEKFPHYDHVYHTLAELATTYKVGIDAIALRFCIDSIPAFKVLSGAATVEHLEANLKASDFRLTPDEIEMLSSLAVDPDAYWAERKALAWN